MFIFRSKPEKFRFSMVADRYSSFGRRASGRWYRPAGAEVAEVAEVAFSEVAFGWVEVKSEVEVVFAELFWIASA